MNSFIELSSSEVLFIADSHFRDRGYPGEAGRRERFIEFLASVPPHAVVFLLGDIFDFYFEYSTVVAKHFFDIYRALYDCHSRGVDLHFVGGNHDYWVGDFLPNELGVTVHGDDILVSSQGRLVRCMHGDYVMPADRGYKIMRAIMRNRYVIRAARFIHPDLMDWLMRAVSKKTRARKRRPQAEMANFVADSDPERYFTRGNDAFVMGHVHYPLHRADNGRDFIILGDWISNFTYARLHNGALTLETFTGANRD